MIDFELTDEQRLIRETARDFADGEIVPRARDNDRNDRRARGRAVEPEVRSQKLVGSVSVLAADL